MRDDIFFDTKPVLCICIHKLQRTHETKESQEKLKGVVKLLMGGVAIGVLMTVFLSMTMCPMTSTSFASDVLYRNCALCHRLTLSAQQISNHGEPGAGVLRGNGGLASVGIQMGFEIGILALRSVYLVRT